MLLLYGPECVEKRVSHMRPPIIIHTAATPLVTPHSSPKTVSKIAIDSSLLDSLLNKQPVGVSNGGYHALLLLATHNETECLLVFEWSQLLNL